MDSNETNQTQTQLRLTRQNQSKAPFPGCDSRKPILKIAKAKLDLGASDVRVVGKQLTKEDDWS